MTDIENEDWPRLGSVIERRIDDLGLTRSGVQKRGGPSPASIRAVINGHSKVMSPSKRRDLERALEWSPGSIDIVLRGGAPEPISDLFVDVAHDLYEPPPPPPEPEPDDLSGSIFEGRMKQYLAEFAVLELDAVESLLPLAGELYAIDTEHQLTKPVSTLLEHIDATLTRVSNLSPGAAPSYDAFVAMQDRIRELTKRHAVLSAEVGRGIGLDTGDPRQSDHELAALESDDPKGPNPEGLDDGVE